MSRFDSQASARFDKGMNYFNFFGNMKINVLEEKEEKLKSLCVCIFLEKLWSIDLYSSKLQFLADS